MNIEIQAAKATTRNIAPPGDKLRRLQFCLRTLMLVVTGAAMLLMFVAQPVRDALDRRGRERSVTAALNWIKRHQSPGNSWTIAGYGPSQHANPANPCATAMAGPVWLQFLSGPAPASPSPAPFNDRQVEADPPAR